VAAALQSLMTGYPPAPENQVTLSNWRAAAFDQWSFQHVRELIPTADIPNEPSKVLPLTVKAEDFRALSFDRNDKTYNLGEFLRATDTDGQVIPVLADTAYAAATLDSTCALAFSGSLPALMTPLVVALGVWLWVETERDLKGGGG